MEPGLNDPGVKRDLQEGHRRDEQALHARGGREAARLASCRSCSPGRPGDSFFPLSYAERLAGEAANARHRRDPGRETFVPLDQPQRVAEEIAAFAASLPEPREPNKRSASFFATCMFFVRREGRCFT